MFFYSHSIHNLLKCKHIGSHHCHPHQAAHALPHCPTGRQPCCYAATALRPMCKGLRSPPCCTAAAALPLAGGSGLPPQGLGRQVVQVGPSLHDVLVLRVQRLAEANHLCDSGSSSSKRQPGEKAQTSSSQAPSTPPCMHAHTHTPVMSHSCGSKTSRLRPYRWLACAEANRQDRQNRVLPQLMKDNAAAAHLLRVLLHSVHAPEDERLVAVGRYRHLDLVAAHLPELRQQRWSGRELPNFPACSL